MPTSVQLIAEHLNNVEIIMQKVRTMYLKELEKEIEAEAASFITTPPCEEDVIDDTDITDTETLKVENINLAQENSRLTILVYALNEEIECLREESDQLGELLVAANEENRILKIKQKG